MTEFAKQIEAHLSALQGIQESNDRLQESVSELKRAVEILKDVLLENSSRPKVSRDPSPGYEV